MNHDIVVGSGGFGDGGKDERESPDSDVSIKQSSNSILVRCVEVHKSYGFFFFNNISNFRLEFQLGQRVKVDILQRPQEQ